MALCLALNRSGDYDGAIAAGLKTVQIQPDLVYAYDVLADAYINKKDYATSIQMSEKALSISASDALAHENLGEAYIGQGKRKEARDEWKHVLMLESTGWNANVATKMLEKYPAEK